MRGMFIKSDKGGMVSTGRQTFVTRQMVEPGLYEFEVVREVNYYVTAVNLTERVNELNVAVRYPDHSDIREAVIIDDNFNSEFVKVRIEKKVKTTYNRYYIPATLLVVKRARVFQKFHKDSLWLVSNESDFKQIRRDATDEEIAVFLNSSSEELFEKGLPQPPPKKESLASEIYRLRLTPANIVVTPFGDAVEIALLTRPNEKIVVKSLTELDEKILELRATK